MRAWMIGCVLMAPGCVTRMGARAMPEVRFHYNEAVAVSGNEQLLLNLVRMRFNHTVQFLEPTNVVTNWSITRNGSIGGTASTTVGDGPFTLLGTLSAGASATESPTITYQPLSGERFVRLMAQPIGPDLLLRLIQSGWEADLVLQLTTEQINDLPAPVDPSEDAPFEVVLRELTKLQRARQLNVVLDPTGARVGLPEKADVTTLLELLGAPEGTRRLTVTGRGFDRADDTLELGTRSLLGALFYASLGIEVAPDDPRVPPYVGRRPPYLHVRSGPIAPSRAYVRIPYRGNWYWIDDADLSTKRTFSLLSLLFSLMSAPDAAGRPVLTVPTGG